MSQRAILRPGIAAVVIMLVGAPATSGLADDKPRVVVERFKGKNRRVFRKEVLKNVRRTYKTIRTRTFRKSAKKHGASLRRPAGLRPVVDELELRALIVGKTSRKRKRYYLEIELIPGASLEPIRWKQRLSKSGALTKSGRAKLRRWLRTNLKELPPEDEEQDDEEQDDEEQDDEEQDDEEQESNDVLEQREVSKSKKGRSLPRKDAADDSDRDARAGQMDDDESERDETEDDVDDRVALADTDELTDADFAVSKDGAEDRDTDELSDADFGFDGSSAAVKGVIERDVEWFRFVFGSSYATRKFRFRAVEDAGGERPPTVKRTTPALAHATIEIRPFAAGLGDGFHTGIGIVGSYAQTLAASGDGLMERRVRAGLAYQVATAFDSQAVVLDLAVHYLRHDVELDDSLALPNVAYQGAELSASFTLPLSKRFSLAATGRYMTAFKAGDISRRSSYGKSRIAGFGVDGDATIEVTRHVTLVANGGFYRYGFEFVGNGALSSAGSVAATDDYISAGLGLGFEL